MGALEEGSQEARTAGRRIMWAVRGLAEQHLGAGELPRMLARLDPTLQRKAAEVRRHTALRRLVGRTACMPICGTCWLMPDLMSSMALPPSAWVERQLARSGHSRNSCHDGVWCAGL